MIRCPSEVGIEYQAVMSGRFLGLLLDVGRWTLGVRRFLL
jgi:hypothetical protein